MTNDGLNSMVYDAENRLVSINSGSATYSYDGKSLRVKKVAGGTTTVYIYSGLPAAAGTKVIAEYQNGAAPSAPTREYIYSGSQLLAKVEGGVTSYYHADQLSVRMMTDSSGNIVGQQGHYPFGESWYQTNTTTKWLFTSYERDTESGNDYASFRYDVNRLGRFASPDLLAGSAADPQSLNRYAYVRDDPVNLVDPLGLHDCLAIGDDGRCLVTQGGGGGLGLGPAGPDQLGSYVYVDAFGLVNTQEVSALVTRFAQSVEISDGLGNTFYLYGGPDRESGEVPGDFQFALCEVLGICGPHDGSGRSAANCVQGALQQALGVPFQEASDNGERGGHEDLGFKSVDRLTAAQADFISSVLSSNTGFPLGSRIDTSYGALHVTSSASILPQAGQVFNVTAHLDLFNANGGLFGAIGHFSADFIGGHIAQFFHGSIDKKCAPPS